MTLDEINLLKLATVNLEKYLLSDEEDLLKLVVPDSKFRFVYTKKVRLKNGRRNRHSKV